MLEFKSITVYENIFFSKLQHSPLPVELLKFSFKEIPNPFGNTLLYSLKDSLK